MNIQSDENNREIQEGLAVEAMLQTGGWKIIKPILQEKLESVQLKRRLSDDPSIVMACVRQEDGIMFIEETIQEIISVGNDAALRAA